MGRREYKYLIDEATAERVRRVIAGVCEIDENARATGGTYLTDTLYLDTLALDIYRATIENESHRQKLRIRTYPDTPGAPVFFEVKRRRDDVIVKSRARVGADWATLLERCDLSAVPRDQQGGAEAFFAHYHGGRRGPVVPQVIVRYRREPYSSLIDDYVRVTFDRELQYQPCSDLTLATDPRRWTPIDDPSASGFGARSLIVLELKFTGPPPSWLRALVKGLELPRLAFCKYARAIDSMLMRPGERLPG